MKSNQVLIIGSVITIILIILWQFEVIGEPIAALGGAFLTLIGYLITNNNKRLFGNDKVVVEEKNNEAKISQKHSGTGDNVGGDKNIY